MQTKVRASRRLRPVYVAVLVGLGLFLSGCANSPRQDTLTSKGPFNRQILHLFKPVFWIAAGVFFLVEGLILYAVVRFRAREGQEEEAPKQIHGNFRLETTLTAIPLIILLGISVPTVGTVLSLSRKPAGNPLTVEVVGHRWWWEFRYGGSAKGVVTANELHIPAGKPVYLRMTSVDVIHSFWVPKLNGKRDVIPGRLQTMKIEADRPGTYYGQCTEFCGLSHANMRNRAIAMTPADFDRWVADQKQKAAKPSAGSMAAAGLDLFTTKGCSGCHTVYGVSNGKVGPNLTHLQSRTVFAGGIFKMSAANLATWLRNPPGEKPGSIMPNLNLKEDEIAKLVAYLETLK